MDRNKLRDATRLLSEIDQINDFICILHGPYKPCLAISLVDDEGKEFERVELKSVNVPNSFESLKKEIEKLLESENEKLLKLVDEL